MRILALNGASGAAGATLGLLSLQDDAPHVLAHVTAPGRDGSDRLPLLLAGQLQRLDWPPSSLDVIAVIVGPGSFTGLRASLALAHGLALGSRAVLVGVTIAEALGPALTEEAAGDAIWCVSQARRDRVFVEQPGDAGWTVSACMLALLPIPTGAVLLGGDAAASVGEILGRQGVSVRVSAQLAPSPRAIAAAALTQLRGIAAGRPVQPLYVDPPEAKLPAPRRTQPAA